MEIKDLNLFLRYCSQMDWQRPKVLIVSGQDIDLANPVIIQIKNKLEQIAKNYELISFTNEPQEAQRLELELANVPLFSTYRFLLVRQAEDIFKELVLSKMRLQAITNDIKNLPVCTLLLILYTGAPPRRFLNIFSEDSLHLITNKLYANKIEAVLESTLRQHKIKLSQEAFYFLLENVAAKTGAIEQAIGRLKFFDKSNAELGIDDLRSVFFPSQGWDPFALVDALFIRDLKAIILQFKRYNASTDSFFVLVKLLLRRVDEIRMAQIAYEQRLSEKELIFLLGIGTRPPFIQKKILTRLRSETINFDENRRLKIYELLIAIQKDFRSFVPIARHLEYFQEASLRLFLN